MAILNRVRGNGGKWNNLFQRVLEGVGLAEPRVQIPLQVTALNFKKIFPESILELLDFGKLKVFSLKS